MTNGEVFTKMFPEFKVERVGDDFFNHIEINLGRIAGYDLDHRHVWLSSEWWDDAYKGYGKEDKNEIQC